MKKTIYFKKAKTANYYGGKIYPFTSSLDLLCFSPISFLDRIRAGIVTLYLKIKKNWQTLENTTAFDWFSKYFGERTFNVLWKPLLESKFGNLAKEISAVWLWGRIYERPASFGYFKGGFAVITDALEKYLKELGVKIYTDMAVTSIEKKGNGFKIESPLGVNEFDKVIVAAPPAIFARIAQHILSSKEIEDLKKFDYVGTICAIVVLKKHFSKFYWTNIIDDEFPFVALIEQTNFVPEDTYKGAHPIYLARYLDSSSEMYKKSPEELWDTFIPAMKKLNPDFKESDILEKHLFKAPYTQPVVKTGFASIRPRFKTETSGLWWVSMSHIYPWDRGTDHSFHAGRELVKEMFANDL